MTTASVRHGDGVTLPVARAAELDRSEPEAQWLVQKLWTRRAVGVIGGRPKSAKSWFGLDLALSVASETLCLGRFAVDDPGPALVYLAEDALGTVRSRLEGLCRHRGLDLARLDLFVITAPTLRLDLDRDQQRLDATVAALQPRLLLLDPLVRLHRLDENDSGAVSGLLGFLRELERRHDLAVALVHHMSKRRSADLGQALRGSGDIHAWTDSSAFLTRQRDRLVLSTEHRSVAAPEPIEVELVSDDDGGAHLEIAGQADKVALSDTQPASISDRVLAAFDDDGAPMRRGELRRRLGINNQRLGDALAELLEAGALERTVAGWKRRNGHELAR